MLQNPAKKRTVAIIQARMSSVRFPGKMLAPLGAFPIIEWVIHRVKRASKLDDIILATSELSSDDPLADVASNLGVKVFRGNEQDVLGRFLNASQLTQSNQIVRVCADNPFIDGVEIDRLIDFYLANPCDYACNHQNRMNSGYADGFGAEIIDLKILRQIADIARDLRYREHVTLYLWDHIQKYRMLSVPAPAGLSYPHLRFDVDTPEDLLKLESAVNAGIGLDTPAFEIVNWALKQDENIR
ncbi:glycosyltransferase family protein [bacterium]|nr:glycosyltransferase family protein [bacterium]